MNLLKQKKLVNKLTEDTEDMKAIVQEVLELPNIIGATETQILSKTVKKINIVRSLFNRRF